MTRTRCTRSAESSVSMISMEMMWRTRIYYGLFALQHRGQESCGIAVSDTAGPKGKVSSLKGMGLVNEVYTPDSLSKLKGNIGVGHVRYSTAGASTIENAQPLVLNYVKELWDLHTTAIW